MEVEKKNTTYEAIVQTSAPEVQVQITTPKVRHYWKPLTLLLFFWATGVGSSVGHVVYYKQQDGIIVQSPLEQESNIRIGTTLAFISQIALSAAVWEVYTQMVWLSNISGPASTATPNERKPGPPLTMPTLNKIFSADRSIWWVPSYSMFRTFTAGYVIALFGWLLILPGFFTPGTLFVYEDVVAETKPLSVPYLHIANGTFGHNYSYSPNYFRNDLPEITNDVTRDFNGPRTIVTLLTTAASAGRMLALTPPANVSSYSLNFYGPMVRCTFADQGAVSTMDSILQEQMNHMARGAKRNITAYYAFVPSYDEQGKLTPLDEVRYQSPMNATNEIWLTYYRYNLSEPGCNSYRHYSICRLFNATYDVNLHWDHSFQNITGAATLVSDTPVPYPTDQFPVISDMVQHAYSAFFWALADQVTGLFAWYRFKEVNSSNGTGTPRQFGMIRSPIQHNVLLGSSDLNLYFNLNKRPDYCRAGEGILGDQRLQDIKLARGRTLHELIEEMSFNMTVSLMHNDLMTLEVLRDVTIWDPVNRYGYSVTGLLIPYGLACGFTTFIVIIGLAFMMRYGPMPDRYVQDILAAAEPETLIIAKEPDVDHRSFRLGIQIRAGQKRPSIFVEPKPSPRR